MMTISLSQVSKRFNRDWIFRNFSYNFVSGQTYAITGPNGSGKSTLLQVISGAIAMSEGDIRYEVEPQTTSQLSKLKTDTKIIPADQAFKYISITAPYLEVVEEMTAPEFLQFHHTFKPLLYGFNIKKIIAIVGLENAGNKQIRYYSSGMKQRIKLAQCFFSNTPVVLLDEPCTNLDDEGMKLYQTLISEYCEQRLVIVSSNDINEFGFCKEKISILNYK